MADKRKISKGIAGMTQLPISWLLLVRTLLVAVQSRATKEPAYLLSLLSFFLSVDGVTVCVQCLLTFLRFSNVVWRLVPPT